MLPKQQAWKRHVAVGAAVLALAALNVAFAQPKGEVEVPRERATVVITLDVSRSMIAEDVAPNRLDAAKAAAQDFLTMLPVGFNVALVSFAGTPTVVVPPTTDRGVVSAAIDNLQVAPSTAIGEGIYSALDALAQAPPDPDHPDEPAPGAIVLLSDGYTNVGRPSELAAARGEETQDRRSTRSPTARRTVTSTTTDAASRCRSTPPNWPRWRRCPAARRSQPVRWAN